MWTVLVWNNYWIHGIITFINYLHIDFNLSRVRATSNYSKPWHHSLLLLLQCWLHSVFCQNCDISTGNSYTHRYEIHCWQTWAAYGDNRFVSVCMMKGSTNWAYLCGAKVHVCLGRRLCFVCVCVCVAAWIFLIRLHNSRKPVCSVL